MRSFKALKNIAVYGKYVKMGEVIQMEDEKAKAFLEKNLVEEVKEPSDKEQDKEQDKKPNDKKQDKKSDNSKNQKI